MDEAMKEPPTAQLRLEGKQRVQTETSVPTRPTQGATLPVS